jgi:hypothetical protein
MCLGDARSNSLRCAVMQGHCDMETFGGGWLMCYTTAGEVHVSRETVPLVPGATYGRDGYRADCRHYPFNQARPYQDAARSLPPFSSFTHMTRRPLLAAQWTRGCRLLAEPFQAASNCWLAASLPDGGYPANLASGLAGMALGRRPSGMALGRDHTIPACTRTAAVA